MSRGVTSTWEPNYGGQRDFSDAQMSARLEVNEAIKMLGKLGSSVALNVCCYGIPVSSIDHAFGWRAGQSMVILRGTLDDLARHFGILRRDQPRRIVAVIGSFLGVAPAVETT
jgi:hypothetical protein